MAIPALIIAPSAVGDGSDVPILSLSHELQYVLPLGFCKRGHRPMDQTMLAAEERLSKAAGSVTSFLGDPTGAALRGALDSLRRSATRRLRHINAGPADEGFKDCPEKLDGRYTGRGGSALWACVLPHQLHLTHRYVLLVTSRIAVIRVPAITYRQSGATPRSYSRDIGGLERKPPDDSSAAPTGHGGSARPGN
jgi:hypothetical protein